MAQFGCIWPKGELHREDTLKAVGEDGRKIPLQSRITAYYKDGSIKWTAHTAKAKRLGERFCVERLKKGEKEVSVEHSLRLTEQKEGILVETDRISFFAGSSGEKLTSDYRVDGKCRIMAFTSVLRLERRTEEGENVSSAVTGLTGRIRKVTAEEAGPLRAVLKFGGIHKNDADEKSPSSCGSLWGRMIAVWICSIPLNMTDARRRTF